MYLGVGTNADLIEVDPVSGMSRSLLEESYREAAYVYAQVICQNKVICLLSSPLGKIVEYDMNTGEFEDTGFITRQGTSILSKDALVGPVESLTYLNLIGDLLVIDGNTIIRQISSEEGQESYLDKRDGTLHCLTGSGIYQRIKNGEIVFQKDFCDFLEKYYIVSSELLAYDDVIYVPNGRFIVRDLHSGEESCFLVKDEPQASTVTADGVYTANYTDCTVYFYPFETFTQNPSAVFMNDQQFLLADIEDQCRPSQMEVTPDGKYLIIVSGPMYGRFGGAVSVYSLREEKLLYTYPNVVLNHTVKVVKCSSANPGMVWLATFPYGEHTAPEYLNEPAHLILWDIETASIQKDIIPDETAKKLYSIAELDGRVYCVTQALELITYDAVSGQKLACNANDGINEILVADGHLYGISETAFMMIDPITLRTEVLANGFAPLAYFTADPVTGALYAFSDTELIRLDIPA